MCPNIFITQEWQHMDACFIRNSSVVWNPNNVEHKIQSRWTEFMV